MRIRLLRLLFPIAFGSLGACAPTDSPTPVKSGIENFRNLDEPTLKSGGLGLSGQGRLLFESPLSGINSREHYVIELANWQDEGFFILHSHMNSFNRLDGVQVVVHRHNNALEFEMSAPGFPARRLFTMESALENADRIRLRLEIHDGGLEGVRLLVWQDSISYHGEILDKLPLVTAANAIYDSREAKSIWLSHGQGVRWGLQLSNLNLLQAYREVPYVD